MTAVERPPRVRPWLRKAAIAVFVILVPVALHTAWDHHEARRLSRLVAEIRARQEPVDAVPRQVSATAESPENAARYYEAAAALVDGRGLYGVTGLFQRMDFATDGERPQIVQEIRAWLGRNREAEELLNKATALRFEGYSPGTGYNYRVDRLLKLANLASLRTVERLAAGDADAAAVSLVQQMRISRPLAAASPANLSLGLGWAVAPALREVTRFLRAAPSDAALVQVQTALRELDNDRALEQSVLAERAFFLGNYWDQGRGWYADRRETRGSALFYVVRPRITRLTTRRILTMNELRARAAQPWPAGLDVDLPDEPPPRRAGVLAFFWFGEGAYSFVRTYRSRATSIATALALGRSADAAIAAERYRRAHQGRVPESLRQLVPDYLPRVPVDPFSGSEVVYRKSADGAVVYSVGLNRADDGGGKVEYPVFRSVAYQDRKAPPDLGVVLTPAMPR